MEKIKALVQNIEGKMVAIASDESTDRQGDAIKQTEWDLRNFRKNPVLLLSHQYDLPPIGVAKKIRVKDNKLTFEPTFHEITQQAKEVKQMYVDGIMKAFSVGFMGKKKRNELLEISAVSVPANANALVFEKSFTDKEDKEVKSWVKEKQIPTSKVDKPEKKDEVLSAIKDINIRINKINKGRQSVVPKALEKISNQLGYIQRKI